MQKKETEDKTTAGEQIKMVRLSDEKFLKNTKRLGLKNFDKRRILY